MDIKKLIEIKEKCNKNGIMVKDLDTVCSLLNNSNKSIYEVLIELGFVIKFGDINPNGYIIMAIDDDLVSRFNSSKVILIDKNEDEKMYNYLLIKVLYKYLFESDSKYSKHHCNDTTSINEDYFVYKI